MSAKESEEIRNTKRRRSLAIPESTADLPETKKSKAEENGDLPTPPPPPPPADDMQIDIPTKPGMVQISDLERRKRLREILHIILTKLKKKDVYNILHQRPCSLMYPNYKTSSHIDMSNVAERVTKLCYFNIAQFRQAIQRVCVCQTDFFPANTVRHQFAIKFELYARKQTTYRALISLCEQLEIPDEMPRKQLKNMIIGTDLTSETPLCDAPGGPKLKPDSHQDSNENLANPESTNSKSLNPEASLSIVSGAPTDAFINGKPVTIADVAGRIIGAYDLPKKTRTIEDKAYTISYLSYGSYSSFAPSYDSRAATVSRDDSELLFKSKRGDYWNQLAKIANLDETVITEYLAKSRLGESNADETLTEETPNYTPNPSDLATLSELGIDTAFLDAFSHEAHESDDITLPELLQRLSEILPKLLSQQNDRLLSRSRGHIEPDELITAEQIQSTLAKALKLTAPGAACSVDSVRKAMGVKH